MARRTFAVIGLGRFGSAMATTLTELGQDVIGIDASEERVRALADVVQQAVQLDATDAAALRAAGVSEVDAAVVSIGENIESSLLVVMQVKDLGVSTIYAKAVTPLHGRILERLGVSRVIFPEREMAVRIAHGLAVPGLVDFIELSSDSSIVELPTPPEFAGRTLKELGLRPRFGLTLIAIRHRDQAGMERTTVSPGPDSLIENGDILVLLGSNEAMKRIDALR